MSAAAISVMLIVPDAEPAIAWYKDALGARELWNLGGVAASRDPFGHKWSVGDRSPLR